MLDKLTWHFIKACGNEDTIKHALALDALRTVHLFGNDIGYAHMLKTLCRIPHVGLITVDGQNAFRQFGQNGS